MSESRHCLLLQNHARHVMKTLGIGHSERIYHKALATSLTKCQIQHRSEVVTPIMFMGECIGFGRADIVLGDLVVEIKALARCPTRTSGQLKKYMESLAKVEKKACAGMVINFNQNTGGVEVHCEDMPAATRPVPMPVKTSRFFKPAGRLYEDLSRAKESIDAALGKRRRPPDVG